jgi:DnaJ family protein A protein 2
MPIYKRPEEKGNLYIRYNVDFPKPGTLKDKQLQELEKILGPKPAAPKTTAEMEKVQIEKVTAQHEKDSKDRQRAARAAEAYEEDDGHQGRGGVQCAQQ